MTVVHGVDEAEPCGRELATRYGRLTVLDTESDLIGRFLSRYGEWAWFEAIFAASVIPDGARVLDVGAFAGTFGLGVARSRSLGFLCFIEANPFMAPLLRKNVEVNYPSRCLVVEALVAGTEAGARKGFSESGNLGSMSFSVSDDPYTSSAIRTMTLADLRVEHGAFDLVKLDIEGMELEALQGDAGFLAQGRTTLLIEANEDPRSLEVARLLLSWNLELFYFAFPAFNPNNFNGDLQAHFPFAFEAALLAAPGIPPSLSPELKKAGCILKPVLSVEDLKDALWRTPRWGMAEWENAASKQELAAVVGRSLRDESFAEFLAPDATMAPAARITIWQQLEAAQTELQAVKALAEDRLNQLDHMRRQSEQIEEDLQRTAELAAKRLDQLQSSTEELSAIRGSTVWRVSAPLRAFVGRQPALRAVLRRVRTLLGYGLRRWPWWGNGGLLPLPTVVPRAEPVMAIDPDHREAARSHFDAAYYLAANQDVLAAGVDPLDHFLQQGWREGRSPEPGFDVQFYLQSNQDIAAAGINPLLHYIWAGEKEGRLPRRPLEAKRRILAAAVPLRKQAADWEGRIDRSAVLSPAALAAALLDGEGTSGTMVSVSHDDYAANFGGIQNVIADEQRAFEAAGWHYLHVSPAAPLPILADYGQPADYLLRLRLNGKLLGIATFPALAGVLTTLHDRGTRLEIVIHHLKGHVPEFLATLPVAAGSRPIVWVHDFFTVCPAFTLMRNDVKFCGAPPAESAACTVCAFGTDRRDHAPRMGDFFAATCPTVLAPSAVTLDFWRCRGGLIHAASAVEPPAQLVMAMGDDPVATQVGSPLRIAHLGAALMHKGWHVFEDLATRYAKDRRFQFYHLGADGVPSLKYTRDPVRVTPDRRDAMIEAVVRNRIDVVICWSLWPETFCFTVHEALAGGAFVVARKAAGNIWPAVHANAPEQGCTVEDEAELSDLFESGELQMLVARARRSRGALHPGGNTAAFLLNERSGITSQPGLEVVGR